MAISHGVHRSTRLAFECNVPWNSVKKMLVLLLSKDLVYEVSKGRRGKYYYVTSKGKNAVGSYTGLLGLVEV
jgi:predicted transcriptional regulator